MIRFLFCFFITILAVNTIALANKPPVAWPLALPLPTTLFDQKYSDQEYKEVLELLTSGAYSSYSSQESLKKAAQELSLPEALPVVVEVLSLWRTIFVPVLAKLYDDQNEAVMNNVRKDFEVCEEKIKLLKKMYDQILQQLKKQDPELSAKTPDGRKQEFDALLSRFTANELEIREILDKENKDAVDDQKIFSLAATNLHLLNRILLLVQMEQFNIDQSLYDRYNIDHLITVVSGAAITFVSAVYGDGRYIFSWTLGSVVLGSFLSSWIENLVKWRSRIRKKDSNIKNRPPRISPSFITGALYRIDLSRLSKKNASDPSSFSGALAQRFFMLDATTRPSDEKGRQEWFASKIKNCLLLLQPTSPSKE